MTFEKIHDVGAASHGSAWLTANTHCADLISAYHLPMSDDVKRLVSHVILKTLDVVRDRNPNWMEIANAR